MGTYRRSTARCVVSSDNCCNSPLKDKAEDRSFGEITLAVTPTLVARRDILVFHSDSTAPEQQSSGCKVIAHARELGMIHSFVVSVRFGAMVGTVHDYVTKSHAFSAALVV